MFFSPPPFALENLASRDRFGYHPVPNQLAHSPRPGAGAGAGAGAVKTVKTVRARTSDGGLCSKTY